VSGTGDQRAGDWVGTSVRCRSGYRADERPLSFDLHGKRLEIRRLLRSWIEPNCRYFKVLAEDGRSYLLRVDERDDRWSAKPVAERSPAPIP
jgi:hypothetical protein